ncbi:MAG: hypothetical protein AB2A00_41500 [Myxococcota bacterium]
MRACHLPLASLLVLLPLAACSGGDGEEASSTSSSGGADTSSSSGGGNTSSSSGGAASSSSSSSGAASSTSSGGASSSTGGTSSSSGAASSSTSSSGAASTSSSGGASSSSGGSNEVTWGAEVTEDVPDGAEVNTTVTTVVIPAGADVTVGSGVMFTGGAAKIRVLGALTILGSEASPVFLGGRTLEVGSGGTVVASHFEIMGAPVALKVESGAGVVAVDHLTTNGNTKDCDIAGGEVSVDRSHFEGGTSGAVCTISGNTTRPVFTNSYISSAGGDFFVLNGGGSVDANHNILEFTHCAIHSNSATTPSFTYNIFRSNDYAIMFGQGQVEMTNNHIGTASFLDRISDIATSSTTNSVDATGNYFADGSCPADTAKVTYQPCASGPIADVGPLP